MEIPSNLKSKKVSRYKLIRIIRGMQKAVKAECLRCMGIDKMRKVKDCEGLYLEDGNCPLYPFRPWARY